jgi:pyridoxamine 5'-phosphate oxidase
MNPAMANDYSLSEKNTPAHPLVQFDLWYKEHRLSGPEIEGVVFLATATEKGTVSLRTVLLKDYNDSGFTFFTNYNSRKSAQLLANSNVALLFYWPDMNRQVSIEGTAMKTSPEVSDEYFRSRPRESQLAAWASDQSQEISDREYLENRFEHYRKLYEGSEVPRPGHWGGFVIKPDWFEFWQDREHRMHDRIVYSRDAGLWKISRLAP